MIFEIEKLCRDFFWGIVGKRRRIFFMSSKVICRPKSEGGMNIKEVLERNKVTLMRWLWILEYNLNSVWVK